jgi:CRP-like cAMP-binding protein
MTRAGVGKVVPPECWFEDVDRALESAEDIELQSRFPDAPAGAEIPLAQMDICHEMSPEETATLARYLRREEMAAGTVLFREGDPGDRLYLVAKGELTVSVRLAGKEGRTRRLATYGPGVTVGEMAVLEGQRRSADAVVVTAGVMHTLDLAALEDMRREAPDIYNRFMLSLARMIVVRLRTTTLELRAVTG